MEARDDVVKVGARGSAQTSIAPKGTPLKPMPKSVQSTLEKMEKMYAVKNTFIDLRDWDRDADGGHRRTVSSPPSFRCLALDTESYNSDKSTVASSDMSDTCATTFDCAGNPPDQAMMVQEAWAAQYPLMYPAESFFDSELHRSATPWRPNSEVCKLSSNARPWRPNSNSDALPLAQLTQLSGAFATALEPVVKIVAAVASKMSSVYNSNVSVAQDAEGWSIVAVLKSDDAWQMQLLLEAAQAALLSASDSSQRVLVVSCQPLPVSGFRAMLGLVDDKGKACWDLYSSKGCNRGQRCQWQHPRFTRRLDVAVQFEPEIDY